MTNRTQPIARTTRLSRPERREQLLDVTKAIVGADGLHAVSIDRVAREAGISRPIIYEHFSDLGGLLGALLDREGQRALTQLSAVLPQASPGDDVLEVLLEALTGYLLAVQSEPVTWRLVLMPPEGAPTFLHERIDNARAAVVAQLAQLIETAFTPRGGQRSPDPELTAYSMSGLADFWARLLLTDPEHFDLDRILVHARWALSNFAP
ncbi:MAG TPA: TetR/AcrR family transcriptional regulator [Solirubrobacteraceae bacterium]|nr:TetR/AcrR family transcriptional regulator [Solirubrobacteraceae bacterium]